MKFIKEITPKGFRIPSAAMKLSGFQAGRQAEYHVEDSAIVVLKKEMTALELVQAIQSLKRAASGLLVHLVQVCGLCSQCEEDCPYGAAEVPVHLPDELLDRAGIPREARLNAFAEDGDVVISAAPGPDLRDLTPDMMELLRQFGVCLDELDRLLTEGEAIYGK